VRYVELVTDICLTQIAYFARVLLYMLINLRK